MNLDELLYRVPFIGSHVRRYYSYFKTQVALTNLFHVLIGLGLGLLVAESQWITLAWLAIGTGALYHAFALYKGTS